MLKQRILQENIETIMVQKEYTCFRETETKREEGKMDSESVANATIQKITE